MSTSPATRTASLDADRLEPIGPIVRLQVQTASLKCGEKPHRWYDPAPILSVPALRLDSGGVTGVDGEGRDVSDVHHRDHPQSKFRSENGVSVGFSGHYARMRTGSAITSPMASRGRTSSSIRTPGITKMSSRTVS